MVMQKIVLSIFGVFTLLLGNVQAAPKPVTGLEDFVNKYMENNLFGLNKFKGEIEDILSVVKKEPTNGNSMITNELISSKKNLIDASKLGDQCAKESLELLKDDDDKVDIVCPSVDDLVQSAGKIITTTTDIITGSIHSFYIVFADNKTCADFQGFRCFLAKFHQAQTTAFDVVNKLINYKDTAVKLVKVYQDYFGPCKKHVENVQNMLQMYSKCNESKKKTN